MGLQTSFSERGEGHGQYKLSFKHTVSFLQVASLQPVERKNNRNPLGGTAGKLSQSHQASKRPLSDLGRKQPGIPQKTASPWLMFKGGGRKV